MDWTSYKDRNRSWPVYGRVPMPTVLLPGQTRIWASGPGSGHPGFPWFPRKMGCCMVCKVAFKLWERYKISSQYYSSEQTNIHYEPDEDRPDKDSTLSIYMFLAQTVHYHNIQILLAVFLEALGVDPSWTTLTMEKEKFDPFRSERIEIDDFNCFGPPGYFSAFRASTNICTIDHMAKPSEPINGCISKSLSFKFKKAADLSCPSPCALTGLTTRTFSCV